MPIKKYQVRIRKDVSHTRIGVDALKFLGPCKATMIQTLCGSFLNITEAFEKMANIEEFAEYEIISIILVHDDNSEQLGEDFDWDDEE